MKKDANKKYDHHEVEKGRYHWWVKNHFFEADLHSRKKGFALVLPPPNVTGKLHLGHAWDGSLQDALIRYKKLLGYETLFLPGMDHAGIATQTKVESVLKKEGIDRFELGREKFLKETWKWKKEYAKTIRDQWEKLGLALDYQHEKFTLDEDVANLVNYVFVDFYKKGLIYQGKRIVNWDPDQQTAISNVEVSYQEVKGKMYYFKYFLMDKSDYLTIATTRPETIFADQAIVVNPQDKRYEKYWNQNVINPLTNKLIPIITDEYVTMEFGTGVMKVTPAHDQNDFELGERHHLAMPLTLNEDGTVNEMGGHEFQNLDRFVAREKIVEKAKAEKWLVKVENITHQVGISERSQAIVEPYLSTQWFVKMEPLAEKVLQLQDSEDKINFFPGRFNEVLETWMENIHDWTISRQLWWGHRLPVWYHKETKAIYVNTKPPLDEKNWIQDEDVLDTWFSSGLWPFAMLNWTHQTKNSKTFAKFYPNSVLVTGYDIIFFWVARMIVDGLEVVGEKPFNDVLIHGLIRDQEGKKMSKSLGNGIDPMDVIEEYGTDALRFFLLTNSTPGQDIRYSEQKLRDAWNFINKLWNAGRFVLLNLDEDFVPWKDFMKELAKHEEELTDVNKWILSELTKVKDTIIWLLDKYDFGIIGRELYQFVWSKYCSWFIEFSKVDVHNPDPQRRELSQQVLFYVLKEILIVLHPFIPFVTEELYGELHLKESILQEELLLDQFTYETKYLETVMTMIQELREFRLKNKVKKKVFLELNIANVDLETLELLANNQYQINELLVQIVNAKIVSFNEVLEDVSSLPVENFFVEVDNSKFFDRKAELKDLKTKLAELDLELARSKKILANKNFLAKADPIKVEVEQTKYADYEAQYKLLTEKIKLLEK